MAVETFEGGAASANAEHDSSAQDTASPSLIERLLARTIHEPAAANAICAPIAALRAPVAPRRVADTPASRPGPAPCARRASRVLGWRFMNSPGGPTAGREL